MDHYKYLCIPLDLIPEIIQQYNLQAIMDDQAYVYVKICKGMYGLPQAAILAYKLLAQKLPSTPHTQAYGNTQHGISPSHLSLMILVSNTMTKNIPITLLGH